MYLFVKNSLCICLLCRQLRNTFSPIVFIHFTGFNFSTCTEQFHTLADPICVSFNCYLRHQHVLNDYYEWICLVLAIRNCLHWILEIAYKTMTFFYFCEKCLLDSTSTPLRPQCLFLYLIKFNNIDVIYHNSLNKFHFITKFVLHTLFDF